MKKEILNYYDEFIKNADYALETATILKEYVNNFDSNISEEMENKVHAFEKEADKNVHKILNYLIKDFLPPIDREDIVRLVHRIDDFIDSIDEVVINIDILDVTILRDDINKFIDLLYNGCISLKEMMEKFKTSTKYEEIRPIITNVNKVEEDGDNLYQEAIRNLFKTETNAIEVVKWNIIYNGLEECFDSCENISKCIEEIVQKRA